MSTPVGSPSTNQAVEAKPLGQPNRHKSGLKKNCRDLFFVWPLELLHNKLSWEPRTSPYIGFYILPAISRQTDSKGPKKEKNIWPFGQPQQQHLDMHGYFFRGVRARYRREKRARYTTVLLVCSILTESNGVSASVSVNLWVIFFLTFEIFAWSRKWLLLGGSASYKLGRCQVVLGGNRPAFYLLLLYFMAWAVI